MRDSELFGQYLVRLRQEKLQGAHAAALGASGPEDFFHVRCRAHEAELCSRIHGALKELEKDPGEFIKAHLQRERP
jgi:hypothetical protein